MLDGISFFDGDSSAPKLNKQNVFEDLNLQNIEKIEEEAEMIEQKISRDKQFMYSHKLNCKIYPGKLDLLLENQNLRYSDVLKNVSNSKKSKS